jgi:tripeptidyl-peptidase-1
MESDVTVLPNGVPKGWKLIGDPAPERLHNTIFSFKHDATKMAELDRIFWEVSDPKHANYGKYLKPDELAGLLAASDEKIAIVTRWLNSYGVTEFNLSSMKDTIIADIPITLLESMLNTKFGLFVRLYDNTEFTRLVKPYFLPENIADILAIVGNTLDFPGGNTPRKVDLGANGNWPNYCGAPCAGKIVPEVILQQYNVSQSKPINAGNGFAVAEFQTQHYDQTDLNDFTTACSLNQITVIDKNGGNMPSECNAGLCVEALLDIEYIRGIGGDIPLADYWFASYSLLNWGTQILNDNNAPWVHSVSYGNDEIQQTSTAYMQQVNTVFQSCGAKGLTIFFASGDQGVWGRSGHNGHFNPDFPAASPYVTAVGGSDLQGPQVGAETCCQDSGGGFSVTFGRPSYQDAAVTGYLTSGVQLPTASNYNATGRAYPDISAIFGLYIPYCISSGGRFEGVAGTSASSPVVASLFANMNNIQLNAGKSPLGFVNPWIYQTWAAHPESFYDVTTGRNNGGSGEGFYAYRGWDPCSGVGTPNYVQMVKYLP